MIDRICNRLPAAFLLGSVALLLAAPGPAFAGYEEGGAYFKQGKYVEAAAEFEEVVNNAPDYHYGYYMLGNCYLKLKKYREAEQQYRKAVEIDPGKPHYHMMLAQSQLQSKKYDAVVVTLDKAESLITDSKQKNLFHRTRGLALARVKDFDRAIADLKKANPAGDHAVAMDLGRACFATGNTACVEDALGKALAKKPGDKVALEMLAKSQIEAARRTSSKSTKQSYYGKAVTSARQLVEAGPDSVEAHEMLGAALLGSDDYAGAIREFEKVLSMQPKNCNAMLNIAQALSKLERWDAMLSSSKQATQCDSKSYLGWTQIAFVHNKKKQWDSAEQAARKSLALKDNSAARQQIEIAQKGRDAQSANKAADAADAEYLQQLADQEAKDADEERRRREWEIRTGGSKKDDGGK